MDTAFNVCSFILKSMILIAAARLGALYEQYFDRYTAIMTRQSHRECKTSLDYKSVLAEDVCLGNQSFSLNREPFATFATFSG